jgi:hypothetical protein
MITNSTLLLVDWDSARRIIGKGAGSSVTRRLDREIENAIEALQEEVANALRPRTEICRVSWRVYHGWHQGTTSTDDRRLFEKFVNGYSSHRVGKLSFGRDFQFGDDMLCGSRRSPLRYTLRRRAQTPGGKPEQKMVDTALIADLLHAARSGTYDECVVIGDDDDLLPGLFTAEQWGARVRLLRLQNTTDLPLLKGRDKGFRLSMMQMREVGR